MLAWRGRTIGSAVFSLILGSLLVASTVAARAETAAPAIGVELNSAEANAKACRLSFVVTNSQPAAIDDMALELVLFDKDGRVDRFVVVRTAKVPAGKNRVRQFDMANADCGAIARVLVNDVKECKGDGLTPELCSDRIKVSSRADIKLDN